MPKNLNVDFMGTLNSHPNISQGNILKYESRSQNKSRIIALFTMQMYHIELQFQVLTHRRALFNFYANMISECKNTHSSITLMMKDCAGGLRQVGFTC